MTKLNLTDYAKHLGRDVSLVHRWIKPGGKLEKAVTRKGRKISINVKKADAILDVMLDRTKSRRPAPEEPQEKGKPTFSLIDAQTKEKYYSAALKKLDLERKQGLLILKSGVEKEAFECARLVRDAILNIPDRISSILAAEKNEGKIEQLLTKELTLALASMAKE